MKAYLPSQHRVDAVTGTQVAAWFRAAEALGFEMYLAGSFYWRTSKPSRTRWAQSTTDWRIIKVQRHQHGFTLTCRALVSGTPDVKVQFPQSYDDEAYLHFRPKQSIALA